MFRIDGRLFRFAPDGVREGEAADVQAEETKEEEPKATFADWFEGQDEATKGLVDSHISGLKNALEGERTRRRELSDQLQEAMKGAEKGSELEAALQGMTERLEAAERRNGFFEGALDPQVGCSNPELAFILAEERKLYDRRGLPDWAAIREMAPELFVRPRTTVPRGADPGAGADSPAPADVNALIRRAARRI